MIYSVYEFFTNDEMECSWLISILSDYQFEGFEETGTSLKAYVPSERITELRLKEILHDNELHHVQYSTAQLPETNWNEEWEKNFEPVIIANRVGIRAPFHKVMNAEFELVIEPKMSFGTGHHATTASMVELMLNENLDQKMVLDFGSGTGVPAILAEKLKAAKIIALDHEEWAYNNCLENTGRNHCVNIQCLRGNETFAFDTRFDVILANVNRNVILQNLSKWKSLMSENGILMVSGILLSDEKEVIEGAAKNQLKVKSILRNNGWIAISFQLS